MVSMPLEYLEMEVDWAVNGDGMASALSNFAHRDQRRKMGDDKGKPYFVHPSRIALRFPKGSILRDAGYLHDVVEDTRYTYDYLLDHGIREEVVVIVSYLTKRAGETYYDFIMRIMENPLAVQLKIADIEDNMMSLKEGSLKDKYRLALHVLKG